ncbi:hypothetical protein PMNALOAF_2707 [Methylobacterium adhaesivum]|uniref:Oxidoreductase n=1 Tax=Methylobacterium adhaesivum TaxID=333297 RepID=A0ABT8BLK2_9HYPH|nr:hypothetical protein [Methylobacterium adhaesivum]MDN3592061.1 hypothetical protein [Methylobacterium adhaesivum]GJD31448.1 hypothetical protein PMNALOAF_2707 [Methylobacterium adhaesivum]
MALIPPPQSHTVDAIYAAYAATRARSWEGLGISISDLGNECDRAVWYALRWAAPQEVITGLKAITFETGEIEEERLLNSLRMIGCEVEAVDPFTGKQVRVSAVFGFVRGKIDGKVLGLPEAPKTWHVVECKSAGDKYYKAVAKAQSVREGYFSHWVQLNTYLHLLGFERGLYMLRNKNTGEIYCERVETDHDAAIRMLANAERIVAMHEPPAKLHTNPKAKTAFKCGFCRFKGICHEGAFPRVNCRTCLHATAERLENATISCARWVKPLTPDEQREGCGAHLYLPALVPGELLDADEDAETVTYKLKDGSTWVDGSGKPRVADEAVVLEDVAA